MKAPTATNGISAVSTTPEQSAPRRAHHALWLIPLVLVAASGYLGWQKWRQHESEDLAQARQQLDAMGERINTLRNEQRSHGRRLQQADSLNRVLRDELDGITQRAALLEDTVNKLADPDRHGAQALRLDETEMLLILGEQRLQVAGDLDGARRAYALASGVLDGIDDPAYLSLRQTLLQERAGLDALGVDPRVRAIAQLDVFAQGVTAPDSGGVATSAPAQSWWQRAFGTVLQVQPSDRAIAVQPADRAAALAGLQLEVSLARAAAERRDTRGYDDALHRADAWLQRLAPDSPALTRQRASLKAIAALPLSPALPTLGSTLKQLRQLRTR
ncbi:uroporphyrinogen-III C-methyltransferase [Lysobacter fragariae]